MNTTDDRINAQLTKYFQTVITNAAAQYYKKKFTLIEKELSEESLNLENSLFVNDLTIADITIFGIPLIIENNALLQAMETLSKSEQYFLVEKFIFDKTDREIGEVLGISRQGVTNLKHRLYKRLYSQL
ncbi:sigma-70 family RNA polymerase sigma factor [Enterococcus sp. UD-01]|jgi:RNA polymerase sigma factor (sigma-70 family)|uniref:sigma-70 family RNA polymerase sigma factor n=1 Tax=Enterococcus sp. UD-01 TaxID=3373911 RepID=UPI003833096A